MKTTIELPERLLKQVRLLARKRGKSLKEVFTEALQRIVFETPSSSTQPEWMHCFGAFKESSAGTLEIQKVLDSEFSKINNEDWR